MELVGEDVNYEQEGRRLAQGQAKFQKKLSLAHSISRSNKHLAYLTKVSFIFASYPGIWSGDVSRRNTPL